MSEEQLKEIYEKAKNNSVGRDKVASAVRYKTQAVLKKSMAVVLAVFLAMGCVGCGITHNATPKDNDTYIEDVDDSYMKDDESGYSSAEVSIFEKLRAMDLLDDNNMDNYDADGAHRDYHYVASDYADVEGLDESYLYGFYVLAGEEDANEMAMALGYKSLDDFMIQNGYIDVNGNPSISKWSDADLINMREIMVSEYGAKGDHK